LNAREGTLKKDCVLRGGHAIWSEWGKTGKGKVRLDVFRSARHGGIQKFGKKHCNEGKSSTIYFDWVPARENGKERRGGKRSVISEGGKPSESTPHSTQEGGGILISICVKWDEVKGKDGVEIAAILWREGNVI